MSTETDSRTTTRIRRLTAASVLTLLAALIPVVLPQSGIVPTAAAASNATIFGVAVGPGQAPVSVTVELFNSNWKYIARKRSTSGGVFRFTGLPAGTYYLQASDNKQPWDIKRLARTDAAVYVGAGRSEQRDIVMHRGAFVTGVITVGKSNKRASRATVRVASQYGASYTTTADNKGRFALGGLPGNQKYSVFGWERTKTFAGKSVWVGKLKSGKGSNVALRMRTKASAYAGILRVNGVPTSGTIWATMVSRATGQWWTAAIRNGDLSGFKGLYPGSYTLQLPETNQIVAQNVYVPAARAGRTKLVTLNARALPPCAAPTATATTTTTAHATATVTATYYPPAERAVRCPMTATEKATTTSTATVTATQTICPSPSATVTATAKATVTATTTVTATVVLPASRAVARAVAGCPATATTTVTTTTTASARATTTVTVTPTP